MKTEVKRKSRIGFAGMDPVRQREIASQGGKAAHALGRGHEWTKEEAREAGKKGGLKAHGGKGKNFDTREPEQTDTN